jgi:hypothetical protein
MLKIKSGKEEIIYLLNKSIEKYKSETGQQIILNTNRKNYESLAIVLSEISNRLPAKVEDWGTDPYLPEINPNAKEYPYRKYDITGGQIKDALSGIVANPRPFLVDACYVYLYGIGKKAFKQNPIDDNLIEKSETDKQIEDLNTVDRNIGFTTQLSLLNQNRVKSKKIITILSSLVVIFILVIAFLLVDFFSSKNNWEQVKADMNILPYPPSKAEIDSLEGVWLCYTGSPQARISDPERYRKVVPNLVDIKYKKGYFTFTRYGASFDHVGFMQFESPKIVSVFSKVKNNTNKVESPRHSLLSLNTNQSFQSAISASWNFDVGEKNKIIGIREIYIKQGKGGSIEEVINEVENASCKCKLIRWHLANNVTKTFYLKNEFLDSIALKQIIPLINEKSILLNEPQIGLILSNDSIK